MTLSTSATPINGEEALKIILRQFNHLVENTPGLDFASSYHRITIKGEFQLGAYPADTKCPRKEIEFNINSIPTNRGENEELFQYVQRLETNREELLHLLSQIDEELTNVNPVTRVEFDLDTLNEEGKSVPDKLRVEQGLPIPTVVKQGGRNVEVYKEVTQKPSGGFGFGAGRK